MAKRWVIGVMLFWLGLLSVRADGKVFPPTAYSIPEIPEQQALIHYANGVEKLVIQTSFTGQGTNFAWIVPLPAVPKIEAATSGLFPTLQYQFQPKVLHNESAWFGGLIALYALIRLLWKTDCTGKVLLEDWICCFAFGGGTGLMIDSPGPWLLFPIPMLFAVQRVRQGTERSLAVLWMILICTLLSSMLLSSLGTSGVSVATSDSVTVHRRETVGSYETVVISAQKADELLDWLQTNGFATPKNITPVIADYIKDGWVFAAARLSRTEQNGGSAIHPLMFTFPTQKPVYPMRLTGVGNGNLKVDLYVFGAQRAKADNFKVSRCAGISYPVTNDYYRNSREIIYVGHPGLSKIAEQAAVATKLQATLTSAQMQQDIWLGWEPFRAHQDVFYSSKGAWITALNWVVPVILLGFLLAEFEVLHRWIGSLLRFRLSLVVIAFVCAVILMQTLPQISIRLSRMRPYWVNSIHSGFQRQLANELDQITSTNHALDLRLWLAEKVAVRQDFERLNPCDGRPYRQEDSPGNFRLVVRTNGFDYIWYDPLGFEQKITYPE